ncbi:MAG: ATP-binding cassette domain-containing protein [Verrucomicrobiae bacterium]|nr:ATP-binding cassette domain-containing protein [Verrucomicrobiae bacterium]
MTATASTLLQLRGVRKHFGGVKALDGVDFELRAGEIHALLGENGAGKSTLIKVLGGIHLPDSGEIFLDGSPAHIRSVSDANRMGVRIIHQELALAPNLTVAENIYLGREPCRFALLDRGRMNRDAVGLVRELRLSEIHDVTAVVSRLSVARQQLVEIARALSSQARILVLDEPTSSLSEAETESLFATLRRLRAQGVGIIYISHRLEEILRLADRVTVLRDGHSIGTQRVGAINQRELVRWMVGRDIAQHYARAAHRPGGVALEVCGLRNGRVQGVSFTLRYGEILSFAGLVGAGLLHRTRFGQHLYAMGGNREAARFTGIPLARIEITVYVICSLLAGVAGMISAAQLYSAEPASGEGFELNAIAAVVVGGTSFTGGVGTMYGTLIGAVIIGILDKGLNQAGVHFSIQYIVKGLVILAAVYVDVQRRNRHR